MDDDKDNEELADHILRKQIEPQMRAEELRDQGLDIDVVFVSTNPKREGFEVTCGGCGRKATLPFEPPAGKVAICPDCMCGG